MIPRSLGDGLVPISYYIEPCLARAVYGQPAPRWARILLWMLWRGVADRRDPSFVIGGRDVYLRRWHVVPKNRWLNIYLHQFLRSDDDRALHDHPWWNVSILLRGAYLEHTEEAPPVLRRAGQIAARPADRAHRVELIERLPVWTLFVTGPKRREWGFLCPRGWRHWRDFTSASDGGATVGRGCE
jgi:hypothetical protein